MVRRFGLWIGGRYVETGSADPILNPYTGEPFAEACRADAANLENAIQTAEACFPVLRRLARGERAAILRRLSELLIRCKDELSGWLVQESGKPIDASDLEIDRLALTLRLSAEEATRDVGEVVALDLHEKTRGVRGLWERFPLGPITAITPFNFPLNLSAHKIGPAFAVGNPVILKPPVQCPTVLYRLAELAREAGMPDGALSVVHGHPPEIERLVTDPRIRLLSFTGSAQVGWRLKSLAGKKKVILELGGNAGAIVHADADLDRAAARLALGAFYQSGQVCISVQRVFVHEPIWERFTDRFVEETKTLPAGDPAQRGTIIGPMINRASADRVMEWVDEARRAGAEVLLEGQQTGTLITPIVLSRVPHTLKVYCEEIFGPVALLEPYKNFEEALQRLNESRYGLQASLFTRDADRIDRAFRTLDVGGLIVNDFPNFRTDNFPYGGMKDSGLGREGVRYAMDEMSEIKMLVIHSNK